METRRPPASHPKRGELGAAGQPVIVRFNNLHSKFMPVDSALMIGCKERFNFIIYKWIKNTICFQAGCKIQDQITSLPFVDRVVKIKKTKAIFRPAQFPSGHLPRLYPNGEPAPRSFR